MLAKHSYCYLSYYPWLVTQKRSSSLGAMPSVSANQESKQWSFFVPEILGLNSSNYSIYLDRLLAYNQQQSLTESLKLDPAHRGYSGNLSCVYLHIHSPNGFYQIQSEIEIKLKASVGTRGFTKNRRAYLYTYDHNHIVYVLPVVFLKKDLNEIDLTALKREQDQFRASQNTNLSVKQSASSKNIQSIKPSLSSKELNSVKVSTNLKDLLHKLPKDLNHVNPNELVQELPANNAMGKGTLKVGTNNINYFINCEVLFQNQKIGSVDFAISEDEQDFTFINQWLAFFDFLLLNNQHNLNNKNNILDFAHLYQSIEQFADNEEEIGHSKILELIEATSRTILNIRPKIRKNLANHLEYMKVERINQLNSKCLIDLLKLKGDNIKDKARQNKGRLLGIAKHENYNLLENRVLKSFLHRAIGQCNDYLKLVDQYLSDPKLKANSKHYLKVKSYKNKCQELFNIVELQAVPMQLQLPKPNFVLLKDLHYKVIWKNYLSLIYAKQDFYKSVYSQQSLFQDICNLFINACCSHLVERNDLEFNFKLLYGSHVDLSMQQIEGHRLKLGSSAGPFLVSSKGQANAKSYVLEIVAQGSDRYFKFANYLRQSNQEHISYAPTYIKITPVFSNQLSLNQFNQATQPKFIAIYNFHICKDQNHSTKEIFETFYKLVSDQNKAVIFLYSQEGKPVNSQDFYDCVYGLEQEDFDKFNLEQADSLSTDHKVVPVGICTNPKYWSDCMLNLQSVLVKELSKLWK